MKLLKSLSTLLLLAVSGSDAVSLLPTSKAATTKTTTTTTNTGGGTVTATPVPNVYTQVYTQGPTPKPGTLSSSQTSSTTTTKGSTQSYNPYNTTTAPVTQVALSSGSVNSYIVNCPSSSDSQLGGVCFTYNIVQLNANNAYVTFTPTDSTDVNYVILHYENTDGTNQVSPTLVYDSSNNLYSSTVNIANTQMVDFSFTLWSNVVNSQLDTAQCQYNNGVITCPNSSGGSNTNTDSSGQITTTSPVITYNPGNSTATATTTTSSTTTTTGTAVGKTTATSSANTYYTITAATVTTIVVSSIVIMSL